MTGLEIALIVVSVLIMAAVLLQQRAAGLGSAFGSDTTVFTTRRGAEKTLYRLTILLAIIFVLLALTHVYINRPQPTAEPAEQPAVESPAVEQPAAEPTEPTVPPADSSNQ